MLSDPFGNNYLILMHLDKQLFYVNKKLFNIKRSIWLTNQRSHPNKYFNK